MRTRKDVWGLGAPWNDTLLWYARGVRVLQSRPLNVKTSWRYLAAMHGFNQTLWTRLGYFRKTDRLPGAAERRVYWSQCQHQSWYFLPWHRAYLLSFEAIVAAAIKDLHGPDDWALPYWNYSDTKNHQAPTIHPAFLDRRMPDGSGDNPLFVRARFGRSVLAQHASLVGRIEDKDFVGSESGALVGVGGPKTPFSNSGDEEGLIEAAPHDFVHTDIGGAGGVLSDPRSAGLDPLFWVHHANIDRLWEVWRNRNKADLNPTDPHWLNGPANRAFAIFGADGRDIPSKPKDVVDTTALGYNYQDISDPLPDANRRATRLAAFAEMLAAAPEAAGAPAEMPDRAKVEVLGSNDQSVTLGPQTAVATVKLAAPAASRLAESFSASAMSPDAPSEPDRVFLRLDNIKGGNGAATFDVYLDPKDSAAHAPGQRVGAISLFGLEHASDPKGPHGGQGLSKILEVTQAIDALHISPQGIGDSVKVRIVPSSNVQDTDAITVGQVSFVRKAS